MNTKFWSKTSRAQKPTSKKGAVREWADAVMFAVVFATLIRWATFEAYAIPTSSMEGTVLVGDYLFVSKLHYGARTPVTPLQVPLTHQTLWGTDLPSYSDAIQLAPHRLPGFSQIQRNDAVVFNYPAEAGHPIDLKTYYIKRCIGLSGDTLAIREGQVTVNGHAVPLAATAQFRYLLETERVLNHDFFEDRGISETYQVPKGYMVLVRPEEARQLARLDFVQQVTPQFAQPGETEPGIFPDAPTLYHWNGDYYGPIYIPRQGATVALTPQTLPLYQKVITEYEHLDNAEVLGGKLYIDGKEVTQYTFRQNYYFMMGDNRHNSLDSRYWGFVPEDHIVGKAMFVWMSLDPNGTYLGKVRWSRLFSRID